MPVHPLLQRKFILRTATLAFIMASLTLGLQIALRTEYRYSVTLFILPQPEMQALPVALGANGPDPLDMIQGIATSDPVIAVLSDRYKMSKIDLSNYVKVAKNSGQSTVSISVQDSDSKRAVSLLRDLIEEMRKLSSSLYLSRSSVQSGFYEEGLRDITERVNDARIRLLKFQKNMEGGASLGELRDGKSVYQRIIELKNSRGTVQARIDAWTEKAESARTKSVREVVPLAEQEKWRKKILDLELQLRTSEITYGPEAPEIARLREEIESVKALARDELARQIDAVSNGDTTELAQLYVEREVLDWQIKEANRLGSIAGTELVDLSQLTMEYEALEDTYKATRIQYERSRVEAKVDTVRWSILEPPHRGYLPANKRYIAYPAYALFGTMVLLSIVQLVRVRT